MRQRASISQRKVDWLPEDLSTESVFGRLETVHEEVNCQFRSPFQCIFFVKIFNPIQQRSSLPVLHKEKKRKTANDFDFANCQVVEENISLVV